jgi:bla regulator protein blaR1
MTIPTYLMPLANHLWQSSVFTVAAGLLCFVMRKDRASLRYWLWLAASVKFLVPFSLLIGLGSLFESSAGPVMAPSRISSMVKDLSQPFELPVPAPLLASVPNCAEPNAHFSVRHLV